MPICSGPSDPGVARQLTLRASCALIWFRCSLAGAHRIVGPHREPVDAGSIETGNVDIGDKPAETSNCPSGEQLVAPQTSSRRAQQQHDRHPADGAAETGRFPRTQRHAMDREFTRLGERSSRVGVPGGYRATPDPDPVYLYTDDVIGILPERNLNNGQPSLHAALIAAAAPQPGEHVVHVGAGVGYYTAILAELVGARGG